MQASLPVAEAKKMRGGAYPYPWKAGAAPWHARPADRSERRGHVLIGIVSEVVMAQEPDLHRPDLHRPERRRKAAAQTEGTRF